MLSKLVADLIREICKNQTALQILYKGFYPFLCDILHTITTKNPQIEAEDDQNFEIQDDEENTMEAAVFNIINIFIENGGQGVKEALSKLLTPILEIMNTSEDANILASGAICLKNFLKFNNEKQKIAQHHLESIVKSVYRLLEPKIAEQASLHSANIILFLFGKVPLLPN